MIRRSITFKLFLVLLTLLLSFALAAVGLQARYFTTYYQEQLDSTLKNSMKTFVRNYTYTDSKDSKQNLLNVFIQENSSMAAIVDGHGQIKYTYDFKITVKTHDGHLIDIPVEDLGTLRELLSLDVYTGDELYIEGVYDKTKGTMVQINYILKNGRKAFVDQKNDSNLAKLDAKGSSTKIVGNKNLVTTAFKATVIAETFPSPNMVGLGPRKNVLNEALQRIPTNLYVSASSKDEFSEITYDSLITNGSFRTFILPLTYTKEPEFIVAMTARKPVDEILSMMGPFYKAITLASLLAAILVSIVFSIFIAKPLVRLNQTALKLSQLNFDSVQEIQSEDELGSLSRSLTSLALNLRQHMEALTVSNQQLQHELEKERNLDKSRRDFVSSVSHEFKTPLAIIRSYSEAIQDRLNPEKSERYIAVILDEIRRLDNLVMDMLDLFKLDSRSQKVIKVPFNLTDLIEEILIKFDLEIQRKQIVCLTQHDERPAWALGDRMRIDQVLKNLMSNALRHAPENSQLKISVLKVNQDDFGTLEYRVEIYNEGTPIGPEHLPFIWDRFYRAELDRGRQSGGTGLGLSIVKSILEAHQSHYGLRNEDHGVTAYFTLEISSPLLTEG